MENNFCLPSQLNSTSRMSLFFLLKGKFLCVSSSLIQLVCCFGTKFVCLLFQRFHGVIFRGFYFFFSKNNRKKIFIHFNCGGLIVVGVFLCCYVQFSHINFRPCLLLENVESGFSRKNAATSRHDSLCVHLIIVIMLQTEKD